MTDIVENSETQDKSVAMDPPAIDKLGIDSLLDDVFGMNIKGLKTIWVLLVSPAKYFKAARSREWMNLYTPSFRVWFGITALSAAFKFIWGGEGSPMKTLYTEQMQMIFTMVEQKAVETGRTLDMTGYSPEASADYLLKYLFLISPFVMIVLIALFAVVYRAWGEKLSYIVRLRNCFAIIITGSAIGFLSSFLTVFIPETIFSMITGLMVGLMFSLYFWTAFQGAYRHLEMDRRVGYSIVITALMAIIVFASTFIALMIAMVPTVINTLPRLGPLPV